MRFIKESRIAASPSVVFAFHESPGAIQRLTPPWEQVELEQGGDSIRPGSRVKLKVMVGPIPLRWIAEHTEYDPGRSFADRQIQGPFSRWFHRHLFLDDEAGGTLLRDEIEYTLPLGWFGRYFGKKRVEARLSRMFDYRHNVTRRIVEARDFAVPPNL